MMRRAALVAAASVLVGAASGAGSAVGADTARQTASLKFTQKRAKRSTGLHLRIDYVNPSDPQAKPPAVRRVVIKLARGARYDTSVPERCTASDAELMLLGAGACPRASRVAVGVVTVDTGVPGPGRFTTADVDFLNNSAEEIYVNTVRGTAARTVLRAQIRGRHNTVDAPLLPGTPPDGGAIDTVKVTNFNIGHEDEGRRLAYIRTPRHCPRRGFWVNRVQFTYYDGVTQIVPTRSPCKRHR